MKRKYLPLVVLTILPVSAFWVYREPGSDTREVDLPLEDTFNSPRAEAEVYEGPRNRQANKQATLAVVREDREDTSWQSQIMVAIDERYYKELDPKKPQEGVDLAAKYGKQIISLADAMQDRITSAVFIKVVSEDFGGRVPKFLLDAVVCSSELRVSTGWASGNLPEAILQPVTRLAKLRGYFSGSESAADLHGLTADLLTHQRRNLVLYSSIRHKNCIRRSAVMAEANLVGLAQARVNILIETDPVLVQTTVQLEELNSDYLKELLCLLPEKVE